MQDLWFFAHLKFIHVFVNPNHNASLPILIGLPKESNDNNQDCWDLLLIVEKMSVIGTVLLF